MECFKTVYMNNNYGKTTVNQTQLFISTKSFNCRASVKSRPTMPMTKRSVQPLVSDEKISKYEKPITRS